jgi:hypothetical protein
MSSSACLPLVFDGATAMPFEPVGSAGGASGGSARVEVFGPFP